MIAVIADDLTGAAELAGVAFLHGLRVSVQTRVQSTTNLDVLVIDTETRSLPPADATAATARVMAQLSESRPDWIYKKTDSLLRGPVAAEIEALLTATGLPRCLLIPANPSRGRLVLDGELWLGDRRVHETDFSHDPEYPRLSARVRDLLESDSDRIIVPDVASQAALHGLADATIREPARVLWAGAADFFQAVLERQRERRPRGPIEGEDRRRPERVVLISGSRSAWCAGHRDVESTADLALRVMPDSLTAREVSDGSRQAWTRELADVITATPRVLVAIGDAAGSTASPPVLADRLATSAVDAIRHAGCVQRVLADGGATAAAVAAAFGWTQFDVAAQSAPGVVLLDPLPGDGPDFLIKVGSYSWPEQEWK